mmetsp:Transcript_18876/g.71949  ORF Transcript_18876/g.71949 Transcript_18876/m.71949 type:complete len:284 (-) Transcript_18876:1514-2365(-)
MWCPHGTSCRGRGASSCTACPSRPWRCASWRRLPTPTAASRRRRLSWRGTRPGTARAPSRCCRARPLCWTLTPSRRATPPRRWWCRAPSPRRSATSTSASTTRRAARAAPPSRCPWTPVGPPPSPRSAPGAAALASAATAAVWRRSTAPPSASATLAGTPTPAAQARSFRPSPSWPRRPSRWASSAPCARTPWTCPATAWPFSRRSGPSSGAPRFSSTWARPTARLTPQLLLPGTARRAWRWPRTCGVRWRGSAWSSRRRWPWRTLPAATLSMSATSRPATRP